MNDENRVGLLEEEGLKRKERLKALKRKHDGISKGPEEDKNEPMKAETLPKPKFRSYRPQNESLKENVLENAKPGNVEDEVQSQLSAANYRVVIEDLDITNLAPRKPDWDLKRDVAKRLEKLERRTQKAIAEIIRDRLKKDQGDLDLATSVNVGAEILLKDRDED